jgi:3-hydroxyisobutyrate dehydrogenase
MKKKVTWIGLGMMGLPMALRLHQACTLTVYARNPDRLHPFQTLAKTTLDLVQSVRDADVVITMLGYPEDVKTVHTSIYPHMKKGSVVIDCTTSDPSLAVSLASIATTFGIKSLDAPVTGGVKGAQNGELMIMIGGNHATYLSVKPLLHLLAKDILYIGEAGKGHYAKLANQIAISGSLASLAESLQFSKKQSLPLDSILKMLNGGAAQSYASEVYGPKMLNHDLEATFYLKHFIKDLKLAMKVSSFPLKTVKLVVDMLETYTQQFPNRGVQSIIEVMDDHT